MEFAGPNMPAPELQRQFDALELRIRFDRFLGVKHQVLIDAPLALNFDELSQSLNVLPGFEYVVPNAAAPIPGRVPNDPEYTAGNQYGIDRINAPSAWDITTGYSGIVVGVIDTGVDHSHPDLAANIWTNPGEIAGNGVDDDGNGYIDDIHGWDFNDDDNDPSDAGNHGTPAAGVIAAVGNNGTGVTGVAWDANIMSLRAIGANATFGGLVAATNYVTEMRRRGVNVRVTNNSYGGASPWTPHRDAIQLNGDVGVLFVTIAQNHGPNNGTRNGGWDNDAFGQAIFPSSYALPNIVSVAATDAADNLAPFSNWGATTVHLAAPGVQIRSTVTGGAYDFRDGTSFAAPHVAGVAALAFSLEPEATYTKVRSAILDGVDVLPQLENDPTRGRLVFTGGRLNARRTLDLMNRASLILNGDVNGNPTNDTLLVRLDPADNTFVEALRNGVQVERVALASVSRIDVNGLGGSDTLEVDINLTKPAVLLGGFGDDVMIGGGGGDVINGGTGNDRADYVNHDSRGVTVTTGSGVNDGYVGEGDDVWGDTEEVWGTAGPDSLTARENNNLLNGRGGNDTLYGMAGTDSLVGGDGDDWLFGSDGNDVLEGDAGADLLQGNAGRDVLSGGTDLFNSIDAVDYADKAAGVTVELDGSANDGNLTDEDGGVRDYVQADVEEVRATAYADTLGASARTTPVRLFGFESDDTIVAGYGSDLVYGGYGDDYLSGGYGNDTLFGDAGNDNLFGGADDDTFYLADGFVDYAHGGDGSTDDSLLDAAASVDRDGSGNLIDSLSGIESF